MTHDCIEPLEPGVWLLRVRKLALRPCVDDAALCASLRHAFHLTQLAPPPWRQMVRCTIDEEGFEELLETGALVAAASALMGERMNCRLALASVAEDADGGMIPAEDDAGESGPTPHGLFRAWLDCLAVLDETPVRREIWASPPVPHRPRSARRPKLTEH